MNKAFFITFLFLFTASASAQQPLGTVSYMLPELYNDDKDGFVIIAHRGASAYYPENTMAAFEGAVEMDAEMIELDVMISKDGMPVVFHDEALNEHTNGTGSLKDYTVEELKKLDAGSWFDPKFSDQRIPTLEEVLQFAKDNIALNIEIKTEAVTDEISGGVVEKSLELVKKYGMKNYVLFSSFDYRAVEQVKQLDPDVSAALLYNKHISKKKLPSELLEEYDADAFNCHHSQLNKKRVKDIKKYDIPVFVYTVNNEKRMRKLIALGVRGIFSDKPDLLRKVAGEMKQQQGD